ncbi:hypothetical protein EDC01DRAFT_377428 [Geopyxis carbonaria]|nr:hypothetical protein EDC01DRAFT_377428 [Geopyxis carbonaria]
MRTSSKGPSAIPKNAFFIVRFLQLFCCIIVLGVLGYFQYNLYNDGYSNPFEFALLDTVAAIAVLNITVSSFFICCCGLSPLYMLIVDALLAVFWAVGFGMLVKAMGTTTTQTCSTTNWGNADGVRICNMYKVLVAFSFLAMFSFFCSFVFAVTIRKREDTTGSYRYQPTENPAINLHSRPASYASTHGLTANNIDSTRQSISERLPHHQPLYSDDNQLPTSSGNVYGTGRREFASDDLGTRLPPRMSYDYNSSENYTKPQIGNSQFGGSFMESPHEEFQYAPSPSNKHDSPLQQAQRSERIL